MKRSVQRCSCRDRAWLKSRTPTPRCGPSLSCGHMSHFSGICYCRWHCPHRCGTGASWPCRQTSGCIWEGGKKGQLNSHQGIYVHEVGRAIGLKMFMGEKKITLLWLSMWQLKLDDLNVSAFLFRQFTECLWIVCPEKSCYIQVEVTDWIRNTVCCCFACYY